MNAFSKGNYTPLHWSALHGSVTCLVKLINLGADLNIRTKAGSHALHLAASVGSLNCLEKLCEQRKPEDSTWNFPVIFLEQVPLDNLQRSPLHCAAANGDVRCVRLMIIKFPTSLKLQDAQGNTPLDIATKKKNDEAAAIIDVRNIL